MLLCKQRGSSAPLLNLKQLIKFYYKFEFFVFFYQIYFLKQNCFCYSNKIILKIHILFINFESILLNVNFIVLHMLVIKKNTEKQKFPFRYCFLPTLGKNF